MSQSSSRSKGLSKDLVDQARANRTKYREKVKSDRNQKVKKSLEAVEKERLIYDSLKNKLKELNKNFDNGRNPEFKDQFEKTSNDFTESRAKLTELQTVLKQNQTEVDTPIPDAADEEETERSMFVPQGGEGQTSASAEAPPSTNSETPPSPSPSVDSEEYLFTPQEARKNAGLQTDGKIVAWREHGTSTRVIVAYGPRNSRKYLRSTLYQESNVIDEDAVQFGPGHRLGDEKLNRKYVRKPSEFKGILAVAFNGPVESLVPKEKVSRRRGEATPRRDPYPVVEIKVRWNINGDVKDTWEVRTSISHLFQSFCDLYIYQAAVHGENQYNAWRAGERASEDRSPTPPSESGIKKEIQPDSTAKASPMKQYLREWCELKEIDPKTMDAQADADFNRAWNLVKLESNNKQ
jgi:hypothetical protein